MNKEQEVLNAICHKNNVCFIGANTFGLACRIFCDFGDSFNVIEIDDSEPGQVLIGDISNVFISYFIVKSRIRMVLLPFRVIVIPSRRVILSAFPMSVV